MRVFISFLLLTAYSAAQQATPGAADPNSVIHVETKIVLVDAVVTDKKGNYVHDLQQKDFKVYEDNKEQTIESFSFEADPASPQAKEPRYLVLFFDNSTMNFGDQVKARKAATNFIDANAGPNRQMAIVNYNGSLQVAQNFTSDAERLKSIVAGTKIAMGPSANNTAGSLSRLAGNFGATNMILAIRELAKNLATVPGRKTLVLLSSGFKVTPDHMPDVMAAIGMCNRSNVAIYPIDMRGLVAPGAMNRVGPSPFANVLYSPQNGIPEGTVGADDDLPLNRNKGRVRPGTRPIIVPRLQNNASANQEIMHMLANGTGGFVIVDTNDMIGGLEKIGKEQNEFYLIGYRPPSGGDTTCHQIRVRLERSGTTVRSRSGYCNTKPKDLLAETPLEKALENRAAAPQPGNIAAVMRAPYFFTGTNVARVNFAIEIPSASLKFDKEKGRLRSTIDILGILYAEDGSVGARFSDVVKLEFGTPKEVEAFQQRPYHYENQLDLGSGKYNLKVVISAGGENFGKLEQPLVVDAYDVKTFSMSSLALSTKFVKAGQADQKVETASLDDRTALIASGFEVTPSGSAKFKTTDRAGMYLEIYEPALMEAEVPKLELALEIRVFDAKGALQLSSGGMRVPVPEKGGSPSIPFAGMIPVATLQPGAYKVEVVAEDSAKHSFSRTANFEVQ